MEKYGLIGEGIAESRSGELFRAAYKGKYTYDLLEGGDFEEPFTKFMEEYRAVNVTAPFKEEAFAVAMAFARQGRGSVSGPCFKIRASNLLVKTAEGIEAHNSDFTGIIISVAEAYFPGVTAQCYAEYGERGYIKVHQFVRQSIGEWFGRKPIALVVGCGGAGRAAAVAAAEMGFGVALMNRTPEKAQAIVEELPEYRFLNVPLSDFRNAFRECDLIIYTLPSRIEAVAELTSDDFSGENQVREENKTIECRANGGRIAKVILEANYKTPAFSGEVMNRLRDGGAKYIPGMRWLVAQGLTGYGIMTGELPDIASLISSRP